MSAGYQRYDDIAVGDRFPDAPARFEVTAADIESFRLATQDSAQSVEAPALLAAVYLRPAQNALKGPPGGIHAKQAFKFLRPVRAGDVLETRLEVMEKYEKKGRRYLVSQTATHNQDGQLVTRGLMTSIWGQE
jgi:3-hydroxybutyryl-CoA dehydratase